MNSLAVFSLVEHHPYVRNLEKDLLTYKNLNGEAKIRKLPYPLESVTTETQPKYLFFGPPEFFDEVQTLLTNERGHVYEIINNRDFHSSTNLEIIEAFEHAIDTLQITNIIVCGQYDWSRTISINKSATHTGKANEFDYKHVINEENAKKDVEFNVVEMCQSIANTTKYQEASAVKTIQIHGWVFDPQQGLLVDLAIDTCLSENHI